MKGISCCGDCGYYNWKKHKCTRAMDEGTAQDNFYADCPLPDVMTVVRCKDCEHSYFASNRIPNEQCWSCEKHGIDVTPDWFCGDGERRENK